MTPRYAAALAVAVLGMAALPHVAHAQTAGSTIDAVLGDYQSSSQAWQSTISSWATGLFWLLALVELLWMGIRLVLRGADFGEFVSDLVQFILFVGFFYAILLNGFNWLTDIVQWFRHAGAAVAAGPGGSANISPAAVLDDAIRIVSTLWNRTNWTTPGYDFEVVMIGIAVLLTLGVVTAYMCEALIESYLVISAGIIFLGFGGSRWTKEFAVKVLNYAISVGAKLFFLQLIVALGMQFINQYTTNPPNDAPGFAELVGVLVTLVAMVIMIPSMIQSLVNGASFSSGGALMGAVGTAAAATAGGAAAFGAAGALGASKALANLTPGASLGTRLGTGARGAAVGLARELPVAAARDLGRRLSGRPGSNHGTAGGRMAGDMMNRIGGASPPPPPTASSAPPSSISGVSS